MEELNLMEGLNVNFKELEHTNSAKFLFLCAGENLTGFISNKLTLYPLLSSYHFFLMHLYILVVYHALLS